MTVTPPDASASPTEILTGPLLRTRPWLHVVAGLAWLVIATNLAIGIAIFVVSTSEAERRLAPTSGVVWCGLSLLYVWPTWNLRRYAHAIGRACTSHDDEDLLKAIAIQPALWVSTVISLLVPPLLWLAALGAGAALRALRGV